MKPRRWLPKIALSVGGVLLALLILEIGLRLFVPWLEFFTVHDADYGYHFIPDNSFEFRPREACPDWGGRVSISSQRLHDQEYPLQPPPDTVRILALGDSFTEALMFPPQEGWTSLLENHLSAVDPTQRYEVINAGRSGMGTALEYLYFIKEGQTFQPDVVLLLFIPNDFADNSRALQPDSRPYLVVDESGDLVVDDSFLDEPLYQRRRINDWLRRQSYVVNLVWWARDQYQIWRAPDAEPLTPGNPLPATATPTIQLTPDEQAAVDITARILVELQQAVRAIGAELIVIHGSSAYQVQRVPMPDVVTLRDSDILLADITTAAGIPYINLLPDLREAAQATPMHGCAENPIGHWSRAGHQVAADAIFAALQARGMLD